MMSDTLLELHQAYLDMITHGTSAVLVKDNGEVECIPPEKINDYIKEQPECK
jgi:hypothetical protein